MTAVCMNNVLCNLHVGCKYLTRYQIYFIIHIYVYIVYRVWGCIAICRPRKPATALVKGVCLGGVHTVRIPRFLEGTLSGFSRAQRRRRPDSVLPRHIVILLSMHVHRKRGTLRGSMAQTHNNNNNNNKQRYHRGTSAPL